MLACITLALTVPEIWDYRIIFPLFLLSLTLFLMARIQKLAPLVIPVTMQSTVTGEEVIDAMDLRAFGTNQRTWLKLLQYAPRDYLFIGLGVAILIICCALKWGFGIGGFFVPDFFTSVLIG